MHGPDVSGLLSVMGSSLLQLGSYQNVIPFPTPNCLFSAGARTDIFRFGTTRIEYHLLQRVPSNSGKTYNCSHFTPKLARFWVADLFSFIINSGIKFAFRAFSKSTSAITTRQRKICLIQIQCSSFSPATYSASLATTYEMRSQSQLKTISVNQLPYGMSFRIDQNIAGCRAVGQ